MKRIPDIIIDQKNTNIKEISRIIPISDIITKNNKPKIKYHRSTL